MAPLLAAAAVSAETAGADESWTGLLAEMCAACHGQAGETPGPVPGISELDAEAMQAFLIGFREGDIEATVMDRIARALGDSDIEALSRKLVEIRQPLPGAPDEENDSQ